VIRSEGTTIPSRLSETEKLTIDSGWATGYRQLARPPAKFRLGPHRAGVGFCLVRRTRRDLADDLIVSVNGKPIFNLGDRPFLGQRRKIDRAHGESRANASCHPGGSFRDGSQRQCAWISESTGAKASPPDALVAVRDGDSIFRMVGALLSPNRMSRRLTSAAVGIGDLTRYLKRPGWQLALSLSVLINVNLAILNLLPFPVLDGGHIVLAHRRIRRKPIDVRA
jgi:regulator of sigma E protease